MNHHLDFLKIAEGLGRSLLADEVERSQKILAMAKDICRPLRVTSKQLDRLSHQIAEVARVKDQDIDRLRESVKRLCSPIETHTHETILKMLGGIH